HKVNHLTEPLADGLHDSNDFLHGVLHLFPRLAEETHGAPRVDIRRCESPRSPKIHRADVTVSHYGMTSSGRVGRAFLRLPSSGASNSVAGYGGGSKPPNGWPGNKQSRGLAGQ